MQAVERWGGRRVLITGATGVIGRALVDQARLLPGAQVVGVSSADVDLRDQAATEAFFAQQRPDLVVHLAARVSGIMGNLKNRAASYLDNIRINTNVVEAARLAGAEKIVAMGTTAIYSDLVKTPMAEDELWLGPPHHSEAPYGHAKRAMLAQLEAYSEQYGLEFAYCICTNLYGPHDRFDEQFGHVVPSLISKFVRAAEDGSAVEVWGSGEPRRDFLYSKDAAAAIMAIADRGQGPINLASGVTTSIRDCAELLADITGYKREIEWDRTKPDGQLMRDYDVSRLKSLGFTPSYDLRRGLEETVLWFRGNQRDVRR